MPIIDNDLPDVQHLMVPLQRCAKCQHTMLEHWPMAGHCNQCQCRADPRCECGEPTSIHYWPEHDG